MDNLLPKRYSTFEDLPNQVKAEIRRFDPKDVESFVNYKMPAMENKSIIDIMNDNEEDKGVALALEIIKRRYDPMGS